MRGSRLTATCAAVTAVLATAGAASASASAPSAPAPSVPVTTDTDVPSGSITATADDELSAEAVRAVELEAEFAQCMRANGIANYPDPHVDDDGIIVVGIPFGNRGDSAMDAAREACQSIGRDADDLVFSQALTVCCGRDDAEVRRRADAIGYAVSDLADDGLVGTPDQIVARIGEYAALGSTRIYLQVLDLADLDDLELLAGSVMSQL